MNKWEGIGGLTRDPELTYSDSGYAVWFATMAVNGTRYDREAGGQVVKTTYVAMSAVGQQAEMLAELNVGKGDEVHVVGELDQYEIEKDGKKDRKTRVRPWVLEVVRRRMSAAKPQASAWASEGPPPF